MGNVAGGVVEWWPRRMNVSALQQD